MSTFDYNCPYCNEGIDDYESDYVNADMVETECPKCEKIFYITGNPRVDYEAIGDCALIKKLPHRLKPVHEIFQPRDGLKEFKCLECHKEFYDWHFPTGKFPKLKEGDFVIVSKEDNENP